MTATKAVRQRGFTVVELVVLISVVGILAAVSAPRFLSVSEMDAVQAHRQLLSDLRFAQRHAAGSGCPVQVDFGAASYTLSQRTNCRTGAFTRDLVDPVSNRAPFTVALPTGLALTSSVDPLVFDALGRATSTAGLTSDVSLDLGGRRLQALGETGLIRVP